MAPQGVDLEEDGHAEKSQKLDQSTANDDIVAPMPFKAENAFHN